MRPNGRSSSHRVAFPPGQVCSPLLGLGSVSSHNPILHGLLLAIVRDLRSLPIPHARVIVSARLIRHLTDVISTSARQTYTRRR